ncbi:MAG: GDP-mannose 4,6-dehydratase [Acidimicrobiales bacterium]
MRVFVTGGDGFVGRWLHEHLIDAGDTVVAPTTDITDAPALRAALADAAPDAVYHLAAVSNVGESWSAPEQTFLVNATGTLHLLEAARALATPPTVLLVCSSEVYGRVGPEDLPLTEDAPLRPVSPYAASKVAAEFLGLQAFLAHGLPVIRVRAFNHIGPGQAPSFVVSSLARQIVEASLVGGGSIAVGNLSPERDFTDVRDVVRAYRLLVERGRPGEVYNVCSGEAVAIEWVAQRLLALAGVDVRLEVDAGRVRTVEMPVVRGDPSRLVTATGWRREHRLEDTLRDVLAAWRTELAGAPRPRPVGGNEPRPDDVVKRA